MNDLIRLIVVVIGLAFLGLGIQGILDQSYIIMSFWDSIYDKLPTLIYLTIGISFTSAGLVPKKVATTR